MFGTSLDAAAADAPAAPSPARPTWDIDVRSYETHERVAFYVARFSGPARGWMADRLQRGTRYEPMIHRKLRQSGLPEDLSYLALIESGYSPSAYSRVGAAGMWQLMPETARDGGLRVDGWVDERRDPVRSTDVAIRFLRWLRGEFGSMYLAAAAYNGGPGRISRGLTRYADDMRGSSGDGFFTLAAQDYLPRETKEYVPQLIAAALVAKDPARYGIRVQPLPEFAYDSARVAGLTPLAAVAKASGSTVAEILDLNPQYLRGVVPPGGGAQVRVPVGRAAGFAAALAALPESERRGVTRVETKKKQTLVDLARATGRSPQLLAAFNPGLEYGKKKRLVPGQTVLVPTAAVAAAARDIPAAPPERAAAPPEPRRGARVRAGTSKSQRESQPSPQPQPQPRSEARMSLTTAARAGSPARGRAKLAPGAAGGASGKPGAKPAVKRPAASASKPAGKAPAKAAKGAKPVTAAARPAKVKAAAKRGNDEGATTAAAPKSSKAKKPSRG
jgi:membrane-bound lytic murein transglycosylase D